MRLSGEGNSNSNGARPVHQIISMIEWIRTSRKSIKEWLSLDGVGRFLLVGLNRSVALLPVAIGGKGYSCDLFGGQHICTCCCP